MILTARTPLSSAARAAARALREQSSRYEADFLAQEAKVDHLQLAYPAAAAKYAEAAGLMAAVDRQKQWELTLVQGGELYNQGNELGDNGALADAIKVYRGSLLVAPRGQRPLDWAMTQNHLGNALWALGARESGTARLEETVTAYRNALREYTREPAPLDWAMTARPSTSAMATGLAVARRHCRRRERLKSAAQTRCLRTDGSPLHRQARAAPVPGGCWDHR